MGKTTGGIKWAGQIALAAAVVAFLAAAWIVYQNVTKPGGGPGVTSPPAGVDLGPARLGPNPAYKTRTLLVDFQGGTTGRAHCTVVQDPFGCRDKVILGELVDAEKGWNKTSFFNDDGFFAVPPDWQGEVLLRFAVRGERRMRVALVSDKGRLKSYYFDAPRLDRWVEVALPLDHVSGRIHPGEKVVDISIWQMGGGADAALYVDRLRLLTE
jgi:hypothetical protein